MVDVEQRALTAFEQHELVVVERLAEDQRGVGDVRAQPLGVAEVLLQHLVGVEPATVVDLGEDLVLLVEGDLDLLGEDARVEQVLHPHTHAVDLVAVRRSDAPPGRADLGLAEVALGDLVEGLVVGHDQVRVRRDQQLGTVDAPGGEPVDLPEQHPRVDDDAVPDDGCDVGGQHSRGKQMQARISGRR